MPSIRSIRCRGRLNLPSDPCRVSRNARASRSASTARFTSRRGQSAKWARSCPMGLSMTAWQPQPPHGSPVCQPLLLWRDSTRAPPSQPAPNTQQPPATTPTLCNCAEPNCSENTKFRVASLRLRGHGPGATVSRPASARHHKSRTAPHRSTPRKTRTEASTPQNASAYEASAGQHHTCTSVSRAGSVLRRYGRSSNGSRCATPPHVERRDVERPFTRAHDRVLMARSSYELSAKG